METTDAIDDGAAAVSELAAMFKGDSVEEAQPNTAPAEEQPETDSEAPDEATDDAGEPDQEAESVEPTIDELELPDGTKVAKDEVLKGYLRQSDYTRKQQEVAEMRRAAEVEVAQIRDAQLQKLNEYASYLSQSDPIGQIDAAIEEANSIGDTEESNRLEIQRIKTINHLQAVQAEQARMKAERDEKDAEQIRQYIAKGHERLNERIPEFKDATKREAVKGSIVEALKKVGYEDGDIAKIGDPRAAELAYYAAKYLESTKATPKAAEKLKGKAVSPSTTARQHGNSSKEVALRNLSEKPSVDSLAQTFKALGL